MKKYYTDEEFKKMKNKGRIGYIISLVFMPFILKIGNIEFAYLIIFIPIMIIVMELVLLHQIGGMKYRQKIDIEEKRIEAKLIAEEMNKINQNIK